MGLEHSGIWGGSTGNWSCCLNLVAEHHPPSIKRSAHFASLPAVIMNADQKETESPVIMKEIELGAYVISFAIYTVISGRSFRTQ